MQPMCGGAWHIGKLPIGFSSNSIKIYTHDVFDLLCYQLKLTNVNNANVINEVDKEILAIYLSFMLNDTQKNPMQM